MTISKATSTHMTTYYCVEPDEYVRFDDDIAGSALSHLEPSLDPSQATAQPPPNGQHTLTLRLRISPKPPHEFEFPTLKRIKGSSHYIETGKYFSWRKLHERNPISVAPPPSLPDEVLVRWTRSNANGAAGAEDGEIEGMGTEEDDTGEGEKKRRPRAKGSRIRGSKKLSKSKHLNADNPSIRQSASASSEQVTPANPSPAVHPLSQSSLAPPPDAGSSAGTPSLLSRISTAPEAGPTVDSNGASAPPKTLSIKGLAAARSAKSSLEAPSTSAQPPAASPPKPLAAGKRLNPVPTSLPAKPPPSLSLTPTPISSRPPSPPPEPSQLSEACETSATSKSPPAPTMSLPSSADLEKSQSLNQINALLARLKRREFPTQPSHRTANGVGGGARRGEAPEMTDEEWGSGGMKASSRPVSREGSRAPSPEAKGGRERRRVHQLRESGAVGAVDEAEGDEEGKDEERKGRRELPPHLQGRTSDRRELLSRSSEGVMSALRRAVPPPAQAAAATTATPAVSPLPPAAAQSASAWSAQHVSEATPSTTLPRPKAALADAPSSPVSPPPPAHKLDWASLMDDDNDDEELPDLTEWGILASDTYEDGDAATAAMDGLSSGRKDEQPSRTLYVPPASRQAPPSPTRPHPHSRRHDVSPRRGPQPPAASAGAVGKASRGGRGGGPSAALFGKLAKGALAGVERGGAAVRDEERARGGTRTKSAGRGRIK